MNRYFDIHDKVFDVTEKYPDLIDLFANHGFENLRNDLLRKTLGKTISVELALKSKKIDVASFEEQMVAVIEGAQVKLSDGLARAVRQDAAGEIKMMGLLPCPIRMQMLEKLGTYLDSSSTVINYELQSASMGLDWLKEDVEKAKSPQDLADIYMSAGYGFFFDKSQIGAYAEQGVFRDMTGGGDINPVFQNENIDLRDPKGIYRIIGIVPAIFMVNTQVLGDRKFPRSWKDLLAPEFAGSLAIPTKDLDLFNAVLLGMLSRYGKEGVRALGRNMFGSMHPAQMVKAGQAANKQNAAAVTIMPYFFSFTAKEDGPMKAVWPEEGAIASPIFFISKQEKREKLQPLLDFLFSEEMGRVLSADGKFPSTHPAIDNRLSPEQRFIWPGWDFLHEHDVAKVLKEAEEVFYGKQEE